MKRNHGNIKMYDYTSKEEFEKHCKEMKERGYHLLDKQFGDMLGHGELDDDKWKYTANYIKSSMF